ncbi:hypothetical protein GGD67_003689 [Bradyrhizobium sp. IAR9]|uniref:hypothetical protein n=1 Tax=Bradyrhizobium sp. IAR9 TaxID=2663841 RepID=UPI0015CB866B|nr:hypothetical protein [Bradyrhizobium sp. IAR9]NYG46218.1 hypothetical protein [Bradyrhizobium sp. IAR9]
MVTKSIPTKTTGPLHFEDLEPHRFEDLVRRLLYDFRQWRELEATGRTGSDEGFDARDEAVQGDSAMELMATTTMVMTAVGTEPIAT